jgi:hypothetical protein
MGFFIGESSTTLTEVEHSAAIHQVGGADDLSAYYARLGADNTFTGVISIGSAVAGSKVAIVGGTATDVQLRVRGAVGQSSNLVSIETSGGTARFQVSPGGNLFTPGDIELDGALNHDGTTIGFFGVAPAVRAAAYTPTNVTADRAYDANATTVDELADVLGSLIADLQLYGLLQ